MSNRTLFLSRLIGPLFTLIALAILIQGQIMVQTFAGMLHDRPLICITAIFILAAGLAIVILHNQWSGGLLPVVITVLGWITLLKGALLLLLPPESLITIYGSLRLGDLLYLYAAIDLVIGIYLTVAGFLATTVKPAI